MPKIGTKFHNLILEEYIYNHATNGNTYIRLKCRCVCGKEIIASPSNIIQGHIKSCGCKKGGEIDITGKKYNNLTALYRDTTKDRVYWYFKCDCGKIKSIFKNNVTSGKTISCGCVHSKIVSENFIKDITGQKFGRLTVISRDGTKPKSSGVYWICKCDCGNTVSVVSQSLRCGDSRSCGCLKKEMTSQLMSLQLDGQKFGKLTVLNREGSFTGTDGAKYSQWLCQCECGNKKVIRGHDLVRGSVTSCGCLISHGEEKIRKILNAKNINYKTQYHFNDLRSKKNRVLKFDFAILDNKNQLLGLIEYQGEQHFENYKGWFGSQQREETDPLKRNYCKKNNIKLFEIAYYENVEKRLQEILHINLKLA